MSAPCLDLFLEDQSGNPGCVSYSALSRVANTMMPTPPASSSSLTLEIVQQMIVNAFSALGLSSKTKQSHSTWYMDSGASHHMTHPSDNLSQLKPYDGNLQINTTNGGEISHP